LLKQQRERRVKKEKFYLLSRTNDKQRIGNFQRKKGDWGCTSAAGGEKKGREKITDIVVQKGGGKRGKERSSRNDKGWGGDLQAIACVGEKKRKNSLHSFENRPVEKKTKEEGSRLRASSKKRGHEGPPARGGKKKKGETISFPRDLKTEDTMWLPPAGGRGKREEKKALGFQPKKKNSGRATRGLFPRAIPAQSSQQKKKPLSYDKKSSSTGKRGC